MSKKTVLIGGVSLAVALLCCVAAILLGAPQVANLLNASAPIASATESLPAATATSLPIIDHPPMAAPNTAIALPTASLPPATEATTEGSKTGQASPLQLSTEQLLLETVLPGRDQRLLAMRLKHEGREIPEIVKKTAIPYQLGDTDTFWVIDNGQTPPRQFQATASLRYITAHSYWWAAAGHDVAEADLQRSAEQFENQTYPTNRAFFGSEWSPGVDSDVRVHIFMGDVPGVAGLFSASNSYSNLAEPYSNEREMFYINLSALSP
ncbi:MAG TPA: hypothetical protein VFM05_11175, partial [Candidatus Saccharimonadales bacterium]|nr:hypothetical protein [Candidatus Saccharimonadales bacterium]